MRVGILVFVVCFSGAHLAPAQRTCVDYSGHYVMQGEDGQVRVGVSQIACSRVLLTLRSNYLDQSVDSTTFDVSLDDRWQTSAHGLWDSGATSVRAHVNGDTLSLFARPIVSADTSAIDWRYDFIRRPNGDLCSRFIMRGETSFHTAARIGERIGGRGQRGRRARRRTLLDAVERIGSSPRAFARGTAVTLYCADAPTPSAP